jgi:hypothetical protein
MPEYEPVKLSEQTIDELKRLLDELRNKRGYPLEEVTRVLWDSGIRWDLAIHALNTRTPKAFIDFFDHYKQADYAACKAACDGVDYDLLASMLAYEGRQLTHWDYAYGTETYPFFIAGLERLLTLN